MRHASDYAPAKPDLLFPNRHVRYTSIIITWLRGIRDHSSQPKTNNPVTKFKCLISQLNFAANTLAYSTSLEAITHFLQDG